MFLCRKYRIGDKTLVITFRVWCMDLRSCCCRLSYVNSLLFLWASHGFWQAFQERKSEITCEAFYCPQTQLERLMAHKLSCLHFILVTVIVSSICFWRKISLFFNFVFTFQKNKYVKYVFWQRVIAWKFSDLLHKMHVKTPLTSRVNLFVAWSRFTMQYT